MIFYVYEHWRLDRDECFYVGKGRGNRAHRMSRRNKHHQAIVSKVHREGFGVEVRIVASGLDEDEAFRIECERIAFWREAGVDLANYTNGGQGCSGRKLTDEAKAKIGAAHKGKIVSDETKAKFSASRRGKKNKKHSNRLPYTEERKKAISQRLTGEKHFMFGKKHSEETRAKMSASAKARKSSRIGLKHSEESLAKMRASQQARYAAKRNLDNVHD